MVQYLLTDHKAKPAVLFLGRLYSTNFSTQFSIANTNISLLFLNQHCLFEGYSLMYIIFFTFQINELSKKSKFEDEIRQEQEERKRTEEEKALRKQDFLQKAALFK